MAEDFGFVPDAEQEIRFVPDDQNDVSSGETKTNPSLLPRILADIAGGVASAGQGIHNAPYNITKFFSPKTAESFPKFLKPDTEDYGEVLGVKDPNLGDKLLQGIAQYAPYGIGGARALAGKVLVKNPLLNELLKLDIIGSTFGATQSENPILGATLGGTLNVAGGLIGKGISKGLGFMFGTKGATEKFSNKILDYLNKSKEHGGALTPEETAENLATNYSDVKGNPVNVDIGTVTNNPALKNIYGALKYVPFSGASKNINKIKTQLADKEISDLSGEIKNSVAESNLEKNKINDAILGEQKSYQSGADELSGKISEINNQLSKYKLMIEKSPEFLNSLVGENYNRVNLTKDLRNNIVDIFKSNKRASNDLYEPINKSNVRLSDLETDNLLPGYKSAAMDLLARRENIINSFGSASDLGSRLNSELDKAQAFINGGKDYSLSLKDIVERIKNIGRLGASAASSGHRYEATLISKMRDALASDVNETLEMNGYSDLADALKKANEYHIKKILPFWKDAQIKKIVSDKNYIPEQAKLAKAIHSPNNESIFNDLSQDAKNASLYQLVTGGKGTSSGLSNFGAQDIASAYSKLPVDTKKLIASYNPMADQYFEGLRNVIDTHDLLQMTSASLEKELGNLGKTSGKNIADLNKKLEKISGDKKIEKLNAKLEGAKNRKFGINKEKGVLSANLENVIKSGTIGAGLVGGYLNPMTAGLSIPLAMGSRTLSKVLSNPELIQSYIKGKGLASVNNKKLESLIMNAIASSANPLEKTYE